MTRFILAAAICMAAAACAAPQTAYLARNPDVVSRQGAVSEPVFFAQKTKQCGPAALAMVLSYSGMATTPDDLVGEVYNPEREGSLKSAVVAAARRHGRIAYPVGDLAAALRAVSRSRPVLVLQNLALQWYPQWHYAVLVGYDLDGGTVTLHSGTTPFLEMPLSTFERTWRRSGYWGLQLLRPGEFPEGAEENVYVAAIAGVERAGRAEVAAEAYRGALRRWPGNIVAGMGLGNALYSMGRLRAAADAYRTVTRADDRAADAHNNLAHVLAELGDLDEAERAARTAVELGGPNVDVYRKTLQTVRTTREAARAAVY